MTDEQLQRAARRVLGLIDPPLGGPFCPTDELESRIVAILREEMDKAEPSYEPRWIGPQSGIINTTPDDPTQSFVATTE
jgi:hypothetical protein